MTLEQTQNQNEDPLITEVLKYMKDNSMSEIWIARIIKTFEIGFKRVERLMMRMVELGYLSETDNPQKYNLITFKPQS